LNLCVRVTRARGVSVLPRLHGCGGVALGTNLGMGHENAGDWYVRSGMDGQGLEATRSWPTGSFASLNGFLQTARGRRLLSHHPAITTGKEGGGGSRPTNKDAGASGRATPKNSGVSCDDHKKVSRHRGAVRRSSWVMGLDMGGGGWKGDDHEKKKRWGFLFCVPEGPPPRPPAPSPASGRRRFDFAGAGQKWSGGPS
jgi:hypothetical protein